MRLVFSCIIMFIRGRTKTCGNFVDNLFSIFQRQILHKHSDYIDSDRRTSFEAKKTYVYMQLDHKIYANIPNKAAISVTT